MRRIVVLVTLLTLTIVGVGGAYLFLGFYPIGADVPHNKMTYALLEFMREKSIDRASRDIAVPDLTNPEWLLSGGADYNDMCVSCHLKPGKAQSDLSLGLYPKPPNLSAEHEEHEHAEESVEAKARRQFWVIKHGIKASGMPAWGATHSDERIWAMVAFLQRLPELNAAHYQIITARGESHE